jgi:hypothetical protein
LLEQSRFNHVYQIVNVERVDLPVFNQLNFGCWMKWRHPQIAVNVKSLGFPNFAPLDKPYQNMIVALGFVKGCFVLHYQKFAVFHPDFVV